MRHERFFRPVERKVGKWLQRHINDFKEHYELLQSDEILNFNEVLRTVEGTFLKSKKSELINSFDKKTQRSLYRITAQGKEKITIINDPCYQRIDEELPDPRILIYGGDKISPDSGIEIYTKNLRGGNEQLNSMILTGVIRAAIFSLSKKS